MERNLFKEFSVFVRSAMDDATLFVPTHAYVDEVLAILPAVLTDRSTQEYCIVQLNMLIVQCLKKDSLRFFGTIS